MGAENFKKSNDAFGPQDVLLAINALRYLERERVERRNRITELLVAGENYSECESLLQDIDDIQDLKNFIRGDSTDHDFTDRAA